MDEIAYNTADLDDGFEAHLIDLDLLRAEVPIFNAAYQTWTRRYPHGKPKLKFNEALKHVLDLLATDLIENTRNRAQIIAASRPSKTFARQPQRLAGSHRQ